MNLQSLAVPFQIQLFQCVEATYNIQQALALQGNKFQFILPKSYWKQAVEVCHENIGHLGIERTTALLKDHFYWSSIAEDVEKHIKSCPQCLRFKTQPEKAKLNPVIATRPLELVHIDYLTIEAPTNSKSGKRCQCSYHHGPFY